MTCPDGKMHWEAEMLPLLFKQIIFYKMERMGNIMELMDFSAYMNSGKCYCWRYFRKGKNKGYTKTRKTIKIYLEVF